MSQFTYDLSNLDLPTGTYDISVKLKAEDFLDSERSNVVEYTAPLLPEAGHIISMNVDGSDKTFRVLKRNGAVVEVIGMFTVNSDIPFSSSNRTYEGGELDVALNTTWYATLNETAKAAIVDKTIQQALWQPDDSGDPVYRGYYGSTSPGIIAYTLSLDSSNFGNEITRHIYAPSIQEIIDYITDTNITDGELQNYNIWAMLWDTFDPPEDGSEQSFWLRDAVLISACGLLSGSEGRVSFTRYNYGKVIRPAFQIDLRKIDWSFIIH